ncbi:MAG: MBOAT family protein, partial [Lachnospiraceae bacterium]|nr:MBOAT family protein [Lachnospiraceae bacterium]
LTSWFREYIYIPLGGNRKGRIRTYVNLFTVWLITGFWHGASWNFVLWGLYYFVLIVIERLFLGRLLKHSRILSRIYTMLAVICGWVLFAITDIKHVMIYLSRMFTLNPGEDYKENLVPVLIFFALGTLFSTPLMGPLYRGNKNRLAGIIILFVLFWVSVAALVDTAYNPFLYFRF